MTMLSDLPKRVLIIEDEAAIAFDIEGVLREAGLAPVGPALTVPDASRMVDAGGFHAAIVDVGMVQGEGADILSRLTAAGVPFLFLMEPWSCRPLFLGPIQCSSPSTRPTCSGLCRTCWR